MPVRNKYQHYNLRKSKRRNLTVKTFLGVDYSTQKFLIADGRAIDLKNFIYKNGIVQKRNGFEQILLVDDCSYIPSSFDTPSAPLVAEVHTNQNAKQINGIWAFEAEDKKIHIVAHIGCLMYEIENIDRDTATARLLTNGSYAVDGQSHFLAYEFENYKSSAFVGGNKLWFLGGNKYMCLRFRSDGIRYYTEFFAVENSAVAPVPTTCENITYENALVASRSALDKTNLLTKWRKNLLLSGKTKDEESLPAEKRTQYYEYTLDAPIYFESDRDMADFTVSIEERGEVN